MGARTLYDKIIDSHRVMTLSGEGAGESLLLYVDRTVLNEYTSPQAFSGLREAGRKVWRPSAALGVVDHVNSTAANRKGSVADPATRHAICEDYRAAAGIDLEHDATDARARITAPLLALWGARGVVGALYDVLETWREKALNVTGHPIDCGHSPQEEAPAELMQALDAFL